MSKIKVVIQEETSDCGICCLESIIKYHGGYIPLETLRIDTFTDINGCNAYDLINCAKKYGFNAYGKKINDIKSEYNSKTPVIAHLKLTNNFYHFVVLYKIKNNKVHIMDPAIGIKIIDIDKFNKLFTGILLYFEAINQIPSYKKNQYLTKKINSELISNKKFIIKILLLNFFILIFSIIINLEINILNINKYYIYILLLIIICNNILTLKKNKLLIDITNNFNKNILTDFINKVFKLPLKYLKLKRSGELQTRFIELNELSNNLINLILNFLFDLILMFTVLLIILLINCSIGLIIFFISIIYLLINIIIYNKILNYIRYSINLEENYNSNIIDYLKSIETIKNLNKYNYFNININNNLKNKIKINKELSYKIIFIDFLNELIINILLLIALYMVINNKLNIINSLSIFILINYFITTIKKLISYYPIYLSYRTILNKNNDLLSIDLKEDLECVNKFNNIKIQNVTYKINDINIIKNISLSIKNKDKIFLYGKSGIGKSTLMKILNKEIDGYQGIIKIDDIDLKEHNISNLITYVNQNEQLFDDSILNNITLYENIDKEILNKITKICRLDNLISDKSFGIESFIINSSNISGGEKNRIILARSLIHSNNILILDEVLKEVDEDLEKDIINDLIKYFKDKTIIYISHRNLSYLFKKRFNFRKG